MEFSNMILIERVQYTHKGWFLLCPIYCNPAQGDGMNITARFDYIDWWFDINEWLFNFFVDSIQIFNPAYNPKFPFFVTGKA